MSDKPTVETAEATVEVEVAAIVAPAGETKVATGAPEPAAEPTDVVASAESPESTAEKLVKRKSLFNKLGGGKRKEAPKSNDIPAPAVAATETGPAETAAAITEPTVSETATPAAKPAEPAAAPEVPKAAVVAEEKVEVAATAAADKPKPVKRVSLFPFGGGKKKSTDVIPDAAVAAKDKAVAATTAVVESETVVVVAKEEVIVHEAVKTEETAKQHKNFKSLFGFFSRKPVEKKTTETETEVVEEEVAVSETPVAAGAEDAAPKSVDVATETSEPPATTVTSAPAKAEEPVKPVEPAKSVEPAEPAEPAAEVIAPAKTDDAAAAATETKVSAE